MKPAPISKSASRSSPSESVSRIPTLPKNPDDGHLTFYLCDIRRIFIDAHLRAAACDMFAAASGRRFWAATRAVHGRAWHWSFSRRFR